MKQLLRIALLLSLLATQAHNALGQSTLADGLVAYYPFNGNANDVSGNGNNGTVFEAALSADRFGLASSAYVFDGVNDQIVISHSASISPTTQVTVSGWIRPLANEDNKHVVSKGSHVNYFSRSYSLQGPWSDGKWRAALSTGTGEVVVASSAAAVLGQWSHVLMSYDGATVNLYIDGQLSATQAAAGQITQTTEELFLGSHKFYAPSDYWFNGGLDDVRIYNRALSATEVTQLYATEAVPPSITAQPASAAANVGGSATFNTTVTGSPTLIYQWQMNGVNITGATNSTLALSNLQTNQTGGYRIVITNAAGSVTSSVAMLAVNRLVPGLTWGTPGAISYGTLLSGTQLNASSPVAGSFSYSPVAGTLLSAGSQVLAATFTPTDQTVYVTNGIMVTQVVNQAALTVTANNVSREHGQANPALTVRYTGFVNAETNTVLSSQPVASTAATAASLPGTYAITVSGASAANYAVTHVAGSLTVTAAPPAVVSGPTNLTVTATSNASFAVTASGTAPLGYQWYFNITNVLAGATNTSLTVSNVNTTHSGGYSVVITNVAGSSTSGVAALTVNRLSQAISFGPLPLKRTDDAPFPIAASASSGLGVSFTSSNSAVATVSGNTVTITGAGSTTITASQAGNTTYLPASSIGQTLTVAAPPVLNTPPVGQAFALGGGLTLSVNAGGTGPLSYQWQFNGVNIPGANAASLPLANLTATNAGAYRVIVTNAVGMVTSLPVDLYFYGDLKLIAATVLAGSIGQQYRVDFADVVTIGTTNWLTLTNVILPYSPFLVIDPNSPGKTQRYYRAVPLP